MIDFTPLKDWRFVVRWLSLGLITASIIALIKYYF